MQRYHLIRVLNLLGIHEDAARSSGDKVVAPCPFAPFYHSKGSDKKPSFAAFPNDMGKSGFICLSCHQQGTVRHLVTELGRLDPENDTAAALQLVEDAESNNEMDDDLFEDLKKRHLEKFDSPETVKWDEGYSDIFESAWGHPRAREYLVRRRISQRTCNQLNLLYDDIQDRILFTAFDAEGGFFGFTGRYIGEDPPPALPGQPEPIPPPKVRDYASFEKKYIVLGENIWTPDKPLILVEGLFDYARMYELGINTRYNIGCLLGSELTIQKANKIVALGVPTYLFFDNDDAGQAGIYGRGTKAGAIEHLLGHMSLFTVTYPDNVKDPDELSFIHVRDMLRNAEIVESVPKRLSPKKKVSAR